MFLLDDFPLLAATVSPTASTPKPRRPIRDRPACPEPTLGSNMIKLPELFKTGSLRREVAKSSSSHSSLEDPVTQRVLSHVPLPICVITRDGKIIYRNIQFQDSIQVVYDDFRSMFIHSSDAETFMSQLLDVEHRSAPSTLGMYPCHRTHHTEEVRSIEPVLFDWRVSADQPSGLYVVSAM